MMDLTKLNRRDTIIIIAQGYNTVGGKSMETIKVYTIEETAQILKTTTKTILDAIQAGHLDAFRVGSDWRTTEQSIMDFIARGGSQRADSILSRPISSHIKLQEAPAFQYMWPNRFTEEYALAYEGTFEDASRHFEVKVGVGEREAAGKNRKRVLVLLNGRPTVEFAGIDDFEKSKLVASLITLPNKKRLKPHQPIPKEYRSFDVRQYNSLIKGPRAAKTMAVVAKIDDLDTIVLHAINRAIYRDEL
jgi:excisionase family DNA binding protein